MPTPAKTAVKANIVIGFMRVRAKVDAKSAAKSPAAVVLCERKVLIPSVPVIAGVVDSGVQFWDTELVNSR